MQGQKVLCGSSNCIRGEEMITIGICDDEIKYIEQLEEICRRYFTNNQIEGSVIHFDCGESVINYCENDENKRIDLLLLDIEMNGISGIELKERLLNEFMIRNIIFVSSHDECVFDAFSQKTIGFLKKPVEADKLETYVSKIVNEQRLGKIYSFVGDCGKEFSVAAENILYFKGEGGYTKVVYMTMNGLKEDLICKRIGSLEEEFESSNYIRTHKSYIVNVAAIVSIGKEINLKENILIPIGRAYKNGVNRKYTEFAKEFVYSRSLMR